MTDQNSLWSGALLGKEGDPSCIALITVGMHLWEVVKFLN